MDFRCRIIVHVKRKVPAITLKFARSIGNKIARCVKRYDTCGALRARDIPSRIYAIEGNSADSFFFLLLGSLGCHCCLHR